MSEAELVRFGALLDSLDLDPAALPQKLVLPDQPALPEKPALSFDPPRRSK